MFLFNIVLAQQLTLLLRNGQLYPKVTYCFYKKNNMLYDSRIKIVKI